MWRWLERALRQGVLRQGRPRSYQEACRRGLVPDIQTWLNNDRADKKGRHRYSASVYGLDAAHIDKQYARYVERFQIPCKR